MVDGNITPNFNVINGLDASKIKLFHHEGIEQIAIDNIYDERELNIGLDFGTSSVKVVIGDEVLKKAFAVPWYDCSGLDQYLLPSRVWQNDEGYSLISGGEPKRNLKLLLTYNRCAPVDFYNAAAFLALVVRHSRGWLFSEHSDIYRHTRIYWKLTLGLPSENYHKQFLVERFRKLAAAAWLLSLDDHEIISAQFVEEMGEKVLMQSPDTLNDEIKEIRDVELDVVPELSAQIYGFLSSERFDRRATNIFMIIDVGGGTIDSSIFHVQEHRANYFSFNFYANVVEFNGVANLHASRINWFRHAFSKANIGTNIDLTLERMEIPTDFLCALPESYQDYFSGVHIAPSNAEFSPDYQFYKDRVRAQVLKKTLKHATDVAESHYNFRDMPVFVCGGGSRMKFYKKIEEELLSHPNATWFAFRPRKLEVPAILEAPGMMRGDYDRLSVAFGLSFVRVGNIVRQVTPPPLPDPPSKGCPGCGAIYGCYCR